MKRIGALIAAFLAVIASHADSIRISLVTAYPGNIIYELEGHTMLRIQTPAKDVCINWGVFDFTEDDFVYRFVKGETDYMAAEVPTKYAIYEYYMRGRRVDEQLLNLDEAQKAAVMAAVAEEVRPENCRYRYNYVLDNCATRPLALIEGAVNDTLAIDTAVPDGTTFRSVMRQYHANYPWYQFGIDLALGSGIDRPITVREATFVPVFLHNVAPKISLGGQSLVMDDENLLPGSTQGIIDGPTPGMLSPLPVCWIIFGLGLCSLCLSVRKHRRPRLLTTGVFGTFFLAGCLLTFLIFISTHEATSPNWLYLWLNPLCAVPCVLIWLKNCNKALIIYHFANFAAILALAVVGLASIQVINPAFVPLMALDAAISAGTVLVLKWTDR